MFMHSVQITVYRFITTLYFAGKPMKNILVIMGSVRSGRVGPQIANWVVHQTSSESSFKTELIDLNEWHLPMNDEPHVPATGKYTQEHTKKWSQKIAAADGFIFVTPEYNYGYPAALKNALDHLFQEWGNKPAAVVSYGGGGGTKSAGQLKQVFELMQMRLVDTWPAIKLPRSVFETGKISDPNKDLMEYMKDVRAMANQIANLLK